MCAQYDIMLLLLCVLNIYYAFVIMCTQYYIKLLLLCVLNIIICFPYYVYSIL